MSKITTLTIPIESEIRLHSKEDTTKPENRVNLTLFHLLMISSFSNYIKQRLNLPDDSKIYPGPNLISEGFGATGRPDFTISQMNKKIGYIEVELGRENQEQLTRYRKQSLPVYSIVGMANYQEGDLSLEEIYIYLSSITHDADNQTPLSIKLFQNLIEHYIIKGNFRSNNPITVSDKMRQSDIIQELFKYFGQDKILENCRVEKKKIMINTIAENGFSIRIFYNDKNPKGLSLMYRTGGSPFIYFPTHKKLIDYLPQKADACLSYSSLISELGCEETFFRSEKERAKLPLYVVEKEIKRFFDIIALLY